MVLTLVLDSQHGALAWLAPPLLSSLRLLNGDTGEMAPVLLRALLWSVVALTGYVLIRLAVPLPFRRRIDV